MIFDDLVALFEWNSEYVQYLAMEGGAVCVQVGGGNRQQNALLLNTIQPVFRKQNGFEQPHFRIQKFSNVALWPVKVRQKPVLFTKYGASGRIGT